MTNPIRRPAPEGFLWGTAISAHQSEGNNVNSDAWLCENVRSSLYREPSRDACDSYNRYGEDIAIAAAPTAGDSSRPNAGYSTPAAIGTPAAL